MIKFLKRLFVDFREGWKDGAIESSHIIRRLPDLPATDNAPIRGHRVTPIKRGGSKYGAKELKVKIDTNPRTNPPVKPLMIDGLPYVMVTKTEHFGNRTVTECSYELDEENEITKKRRMLDKFKSLAMFGVVDGGAKE